ncbi:hypothetical protein GALL_262950 [mine drainage metagenome]|uniref:Uncharacterized protein n=1 Tax=mine drainage metagenome TaxID=410659 RepID=A0A1J5RI94_9ZZZZ
MIHSPSMMANTSDTASWPATGPSWSAGTSPSTSSASATATVSTVHATMPPRRVSTKNQMCENAMNSRSVPTVLDRTATVTATIMTAR